MKKILMILMVSLGLQLQAQQNWCDSLSYSIFPNTTLTVTGNTNGISNIVDSVYWNFTACNAVACYIPQGNNPYSFPLINLTDTVKLCYDSYVYTPNQMIVCNHCDSLVYDQNMYTWIVFNRMSNPVGLPGFVIEEDGVRWYNDIMYDMLGKPLTNKIPVGTMYIRGGKKYIKLR